MERSVAGLSVENLIAEERGRAHAYGGRTIFGTVKIAGVRLLRAPDNAQKVSN
jgi:hypothetical protein